MEHEDILLRQKQLDEARANIPFGEYKELESGETYDLIGHTIDRTTGVASVIIRHSVYPGLTCIEPAVGFALTTPQEDKTFMWLPGMDIRL